MCAVVMISSGCVTSMNLSRLRSTVFGEPTAEHKRVMLAEAFSAGDQYESMSSMGGGIWPGVPRRRFVKACWTEVKRKRSEEHTSELQSRGHLVCRLLLEKKKKQKIKIQQQIQSKHK